MTTTPEPPTKTQAAAEALRALLRGGSAAVRAALDHADPDIRRAAAKHLLHGDQPDPADRRAAAAQALTDHQQTSLGRGRGWTAQTGNPSDYAQAADSIEAATGLPVTYDSGGHNY